MKYRVLTKNDNGEYILKDTEVFQLPLAMMKNPSEDSGRIDSNFKTALEIVQRWKIENQIFKLTGKLEKITESASASVADAKKVKDCIEALKSLADKLPADSEKPENWFMVLACAIERPNFIVFSSGIALIKTIKRAADDCDYDAVREKLLEFGKTFIPTNESGIKPKKPSFRLTNPNDGRYSIEELVTSCTARKSVVTRKGATYKAPKDSEILYSCFAEIFRECYGIPVSQKHAKKATFKRVVF